jgi:acyl dehydratase
VAVYSQPHTTENVLELVHFEELPLGTEWRTRRRTITAADLAAFVGLSGDFNPLYTDAEHARSGHFGEPVVPGALVAAVTTGLGTIDVPVPATVGLVGMTWRFLRPVRPGDTIQSRWRLNRKRPVENPRWGLAVWQVEVENQRGEVVAVADVTRLVNRREQPAEALRLGKPSRRRRRRGVPEITPGADLPPKPTPGPLREPVVRPAAEWRSPQPQPEPVPPAQEPAAEGTSRRRRRGSDRARAEPPPEPQVAEAPLVPPEPAVVEPPPAEEQPAEPQPEPSPAPAPAAVAAPARTRRRRSATASPPPVDELPGAEPQGEPRPSRRRRRSRPAEPAVTDEPPSSQAAAITEPSAPAEPAPLPEPVEPAPIPSPFRPPPEPEPLHRPPEEPPADDGSGGLAAVLRRLRGG